MRPCNECGDAVANRATYCPTCEERLAGLAATEQEENRKGARLGRGVNISGEPDRQKDHSYEILSMAFAIIMSGIGGLAGLLAGNLLACVIGAAIGFSATWIILWAMRQF